MNESERRILDPIRDLVRRIDHVFHIDPASDATTLGRPKPIFEPIPNCKAQKRDDDGQYDQLPFRNKHDR
jgi:hypothetical protein